MIELIFIGEEMKLHNASLLQEIFKIFGFFLKLINILAVASQNFLLTSMEFISQIYGDFQQISNYNIRLIILRRKFSNSVHTIVKSLDSVVFGSGDASYADDSSGVIDVSKFFTFWYRGGNSLSSDIFLWFTVEGFLKKSPMRF